MKPGWKIAYAIAGTLFSVGLLVYLVQGPRGDAVVLRPPPTPLPVLVHVSGEVKLAGVYSLPAGSRVVDAIEVAGGLSAEANPDGINMAAHLEDGEQIFVPSRNIEVEASSGLNLELQSSTITTDVSNLVNLNTASKQELETLPGIGPALAEEIIAYREAYGPFEDTVDILEVHGIGSVKYEQIKALVTVSEVP